jgi:hypothetical protein
MLDTQTQHHRNLIVDGVTINVLSLPQAVSSIVSAALHGDNFSVCTLNLDHRRRSCGTGVPAGAKEASPHLHDGFE